MTFAAGDAHMTEKFARERFAAIRRRYLAAKERENNYRLAILLPKYGSLRPPTSWLTRTEIARLAQLDRAQDREGDKFCALLDKIGGRNWRTHAPYWWVLEKLTFEDATTTVQLAEIPPAGYGYRPDDMQRFAAPRELETA